MLKDVKFDIGNKIRTKIHFLNDSRTEADGKIIGILIDGENNTIKYKVLFNPNAVRKEQGSTGAYGYVNQDDIICVYRDDYELNED